MSQNRSSIVVLGITVLAVVLMIFAINNANINRFENSVIGTRGLGHWLSENNIDVEQANRRTSLAEEDVSLRILPLYDTDLSDWMQFSNQQRGEGPEVSQRQTSRRIVENKIAATPTLLVLPKWIDRTAELSVFDQQLQHEETAVLRPLFQLNMRQLQLRPHATKVLNEEGYILYRPQLFTAESVKDGCRTVVPLAGGVLVAECNAGTRPFFILSDPDLLNNHGLALGENAQIALDLITDLAGNQDGTVFIDTSDRQILQRDVVNEAPPQPRTTEDLSRYFAYPFNLIWISAGLTFLILMWRGLIRFGPAKQLATGEVEASKTASIDAKSYLLRLAGEDHALLTAYVGDKMTGLAHDVMGQKATMDQPQFLERLRKIAPVNATALETCIDDLSRIGPETPKTELARSLENFERTHRRLRDELGHVSRHG